MKMAHWMKRMFSRTMKKAQITFCGLDAAGKTTVLNYLLQGDKTETVPTTGINYERVVLKNKMSFDIYDLPGQEALRNLHGLAVEVFGSTEGGARTHERI